MTFSTFHKIRRKSFCKKEKLVNLFIDTFVVSVE